MAFAAEQLRVNYRHSMLGLIWIGIGFACFAGVKIVIFGSISDQNAAFFTSWLLCGFLAWMLISSFITKACNVFISSKSWINGVQVPFSVFIFKSIWEEIIKTVFTLIVAITIIIFFGQYSWVGMIFALLAIPLFVLTAIPVFVILGILCVYSRDLLQFVQTFMRILFFATPIIWIPQPGTVTQLVADANPLSYFLMLFREPIMAGALPVKAVLVWAIITVFLWGVAALIFKSQRNTVIYWI